MKMSERRWPPKSRVPGLVIGTIVFIALGLGFLKATDFVFPEGIWLWALPFKTVGPFFMSSIEPWPQRINVMAEIRYLLLYSGLLSGLIIGALSVRSIGESFLGALPNVIVIIGFFTLISVFGAGHGPIFFAIVPSFVSIPYAILGGCMGWVLTIRLTGRRPGEE